MHAGKSWTQKLTYRKRYFVTDEQNDRKKYNQKVMKFSYECVKGFVHIATRVYDFNTEHDFYYNRLGRMASYQLCKHY